MTIQEAARRYINATDEAIRLSREAERVAIAAKNAGISAERAMKEFVDVAPLGTVAAMGKRAAVREANGAKIIDVVLVEAPR